MTEIIYCDGSGDGRVCVVTRGMGKTTLVEHYPEDETHNESEWHSLHTALDHMNKMKINEATIYMDSQLVVRQFNGDYRLRAKNMQKWYWKV